MQILLSPNSTLYSFTPCCNFISLSPTFIDVGNSVLPTVFSPIVRVTAFTSVDFSPIAPAIINDAV